MKHEILMAILKTVTEKSQSWKVKECMVSFDAGFLIVQGEGVAYKISINHFTNEAFHDADRKTDNDPKN